MHENLKLINTLSRLVTLGLCVRGVLEHDLVSGGTYPLLIVLIVGVGSVLLSSAGVYRDILAERRTMRSLVIKNSGTRLDTRVLPPLPKRFTRLFTSLLERLAPPASVTWRSFEDVRSIGLRWAVTLLLVQALWFFSGSDQSIDWTSAPFGPLACGTILGLSSPFLFIKIAVEQHCSKRAIHHALHSKETP